MIHPRRLPPSCHTSMLPPALLLLLSAVLSLATGLCPSQCTCNSTTLVVHCSSGALTTVPHFLNPRIRELYLSGTSIAHLDLGLDFYVQLTVLNISFSKLQSLGENQFTQLNSLIQLQVESNDLEHLHPGGFNGLDNLESLSLRGNRISLLQKTVFAGLLKLKQLDLTENSIHTLEEGTLTDLPSLEVLLLAKNQIREFGNWFPLGFTRVINLSQNLIQRISNSSLTPHSLQELDLSDNLLSAVEPGSLASSPALARLDLSYNKLNSIPALVLSRASNLTELILSGNMIRTIDAESLEVSPRLEHLHLNNMAVLSHILPGSFTPLTRLRSITLANNRKLAPIPSNIFTGLDQLRVLDLSLLPWTSLNPDQVGVSLSTLRLGGTNLQCSCSLSWLLVLLEGRPGVVEGARCDGMDLAQVPHSHFQCADGDLVFIIGVVSGSVLILILIVLVIVLYSCLRSRKTTSQCEYLQYIPSEGETAHPYPDTKGEQGEEYNLPGYGFSTAINEYSMIGDGNVPIYELTPLKSNKLSHVTSQSLTNRQSPVKGFSGCSPLLTASPRKRIQQEDARYSEPLYYTVNPHPLNSGMYKGIVNNPPGVYQQGPPGVYQQNPPGVYQQGPLGGYQQGPPGVYQQGPPGVYQQGPPGVYQQGTTITTNPLSALGSNAPEDYSSGYHGSSSLYTNSSTSSASSTAPDQPKPDPSRQARTLRATEKGGNLLVYRENGRYPDILIFHDRDKTYLV